MVGATATATEMQNNFGKYLSLVMDGKEVIVTRNGKVVGRLIPQSQVVSFLSDSLLGVLSGNYDLDKEKELALKEKYEAADRR
jgi:prevent-host-death family protein